MLKITCEGVYYKNGGFVPAKDGPAAGLPAPEKAREGTMAHAILKAHNTGDNMEIGRASCRERVSSPV